MTLTVRLEWIPLNLSDGSNGQCTGCVPRSVSRLTWLMEVVWVVVGLPVGDWLRDTFALSRNHYDRLGHFVQGFVPAILIREILLRRTPLRPGGWLFVLVSSVCLAFSACFEFLEWWSALALGSAADAFLATQGDVWDTQWDMFLCLIGAILAQLLLSRPHDRQLATIQPSTGGEARELCECRHGRFRTPATLVEFTTEGRALVEQVPSSLLLRIAVVWVGDHIVGVIANHHRSDGLGRLAAARPDLALDVRRRAELWALIDLPDVLPDVVSLSAGERVTTAYLDAGAQ